MIRLCECGVEFVPTDPDEHLCDVCRHEVELVTRDEEAASYYATRGEEQ
jgi:hypothetical protein